MSTRQLLLTQPDQTRSVSTAFDVASILPVLTPASGRVKAARKLARRAYRHERHLFLAEGTKALTEALAVPDCVVEVFVTEAFRQSESALLATVDEADACWYLSTPAAIASLAGTVTPQGVVAVCRFLDVSLEGVLPSARSLVICAEVRDPGNAGTVIRCADAAGFDAVIFAGDSVDAYNEKTVRATVGSLFHPQLCLGGRPHDVVRAVRDAGFVVLAADATGEVSLFEGAKELGERERVAWLFGNEAWGLPESLAAIADHRVAIPIYGRAESLNLATAAALCLYETARPGTFPEEES